MTGKSSAPTSKEMYEINYQGLIKVGQIYKTKYWGDVEVVEYKSARKITVKFIKTGFMRKCQASSLRRGELSDDWARQKYGKPIYKQSVKLGDKFKNDKYGIYEIVEYNSYKDVWIEFHNTEYRCRVSTKDILSGQVRDKLALVIEGIGCFGVGPYMTTSRGKTFANTAYKVWREMLRRCHTKTSDSYLRYGGKGVTVCDEWRNFQVFAEWYEKNYKEGFQIEKDILSGNPKIYSPETCRLVPIKINTAVKGMVDGKLIDYKGYQLDKRSGKYRVCMRIDGKPYSGRYYENAKDAFLEYKRLKESELCRLANKEFSAGNIDELIYNKLISTEIQPHKDDEEVFEWQPVAPVVT